jgi:hypothetical protein
VDALVSWLRHCLHRGFEVALLNAIDKGVEKNLVEIFAK